MEETQQMDFGRDLGVFRLSIHNTDDAYQLERK